MIIMINRPMCATRSIRRLALGFGDALTLADQDLDVRAVILGQRFAPK
jgi:hypothetical protein